MSRERARLHADAPRTACIVRAVAGANVVLKGLVVSNKGWAIEALKEGRRAPEELRVRGFQLVKYEQRVIEFSQPGSYVVDE